MTRPNTIKQMQFLWKFTAIQKQCEELEQLFASISAGTMFYRFEAGLPDVEFPLPKNIGFWFWTLSNKIWGLVFRSKK